MRVFIFIFILSACFDLVIFVRISFLGVFSLHSFAFSPLFLFLPYRFPLLIKKPKQLTFNPFFKNRVSRRKGTLLGRLSFLLVILFILANILITTLLTTASIANYPGGHALALVHSLHPRALHNDTKRKFLKRPDLCYPG